MVDYGWVALAIGGVAIAVFALVTNGGFIFLIGAVGAIVLVVLGALAVRQGSNAPRA